MDMGTGKSRTAIELADRWHVGNVVWFCPVSLKETVRREIKKHVAWARPYVFNYKTNIRTLPKHFWTIIGIESMSSSNRQVLCARGLVGKNTLVIVDESSFIKGHRSWRTLRITNIGKAAGKRLILTGTPISQGVEDLYSQMRFLDPGILNYSSWYTFAKNHLEYSDRYPGLILRSHDTALLADKVAPFVYQVTKDECLDLPPKMYKSLYYEMSYEQKEEYCRTKEEILLSVSIDDMNSYIIFRLFTALQQITSGYRRVGNRIIELPNPRLDMLLDLVQSPSIGKTIIWCKWLRSLHQIAEQLDNRASLLYGALSEKNRNEQIDRFKYDDTQFLVATASTGGHGLNLTEAQTVIFYESSFKYSERLQAEDRCHRIGQDKKVLYVNLTCIDSIDERIVQSLSKKRNAVDDFKAKVDRIKDDLDAMMALLRKL